MPQAKKLNALVFASVLLGAACLTACNTEGTDGDDADTSEVTEEEAGPENLDDTDFGNLTWQFRPGGNAAELERVDLVDGKSTDGSVNYKLGEVISTDLNSDEVADAVVQLTRLDGNAVDDQWYMWIATDEGPAQSTYPVANEANCGTVLHSIEAADGGVEIHEARRSVGDERIPCSDSGTDERTRTVAAVEANNSGEWWPVQIAPIVGFGGLCPMTTHLESYPNESKLYPVPDTAVGNSISIDSPSEVFEIESWEAYGESLPGWTLAGVQEEGNQGCAWAETP